MTETVVVFRGSEQLAEIALAKLRAFDIPHEVTGHGSVPGLSLVTPIEIRVPEEFADQALEVLEEGEVDEAEWRTGDFGDGDNWPNHIAALYRKIASALENDDEAEARRIAEKFLRRHENDETAYLLLAKVERDTAGAQEELRVLREGLQRSTSPVRLSYRLAMLQWQTNPAEAARLFEQLITMFPDSPHGWIGLARMQTSRTEMERLLSEGLGRLDPIQHESVTHLAVNLLVVLGDESTACEALAYRCDEVPTDVYSKIYLGLLLGPDTDEGASWLDEARSEWGEDDDEPYQEAQAEVRGSIEADRAQAFADDDAE